jgi:hypothetical protein
MLAEERLTITAALEGPKNVPNVAPGWPEANGRAEPALATDSVERGGY